RQVELEPWREDAYRQWMRALAMSGHRNAALAQFEACRSVLAEELGVEPEMETVALIEQIRDGALTPDPSTTKTTPMNQPHTTPSVLPEQPAAPPPQPYAPQFPEGERRIVTVVEVEVSGTEALLANTGTENWAAILGQLLRVVGAEVHRYGGEIERYDASGLIAFFGAQRAHEDDPERGVLSALAMKQAFQAQLEHLVDQEPSIDSLDLRVSVHTGEVIVTVVEGGRDAGHRTVIGDAVLSIHRLLALVPPGEVRVSEATYRLVEPLFEWRTPIDSTHGYVPLAHVADASKGRGLPGMYSELVGRASELSALRKAMERLHSGIGGIVTLVGEAGIGKSRLIAEVRELTDLRLIEGRCLSYTGSMAYGLWRDVLRALFEVTPETPPAVVNHALRAHVRALDADRFLPTYAYLGKLLSVPLDADAEALIAQTDAESLQNSTDYAIERLLEHAAARSPLAIICEDLHWADATSLALLERLFSLTDRVPLLLICTFRPQREHGCWRIRETAMRAFPHHHIDLQLTSLSATEGNALLENLLLSVPGPDGRKTVEGLPETLKTQILLRGAGNPFYIEEILRALIHSGAIVCREASCRWEVEQDVEEIGIPETLYGVLRARIDQLPAGARHVLHLASVIGRVFPKRLLAAIAEREELDVHLVTLQREQLIRERARLPEADYIFQHQLTLEAAYGGLLQRVRRVLHRRVADAIERLYAERIDEQLGLLAHHWELAGDAARASAYLHRAGEQAAAQYANAEAITYFERALALLPETDIETRYQILLTREQIYRWQGALEAQGADLAILQKLVREMGDPQRQAEVAVRQAEHAGRSGDFALRAKFAQQAIAWAQMAGDHQLEAWGYMYLEMDIYTPNHPELYLAQALKLARRWDLREMEAHIQRERSQTLVTDGHYAQAKETIEQVLRLWQTVGNRREEGRAYCMRSFVVTLLGEYRTAQRYAEQGLQLCQEVGNRFDEAWAFNALVYTMMRQGLYGTAKTYAEEALAIYRETGDEPGERWTSFDLSQIHYVLGDYSTAVAYNEETSRLPSSESSEMWRLSFRALIIHRQGDSAQAYAIAQQVPQPITKHVHRAVLTIRGHILLSLGRLEEARATYAQAVTEWQSLDLAFLAVEPLAGLAQVAYQQQEFAEAVSFVDAVLQRLENPVALGESFDPFQVYLT
ncbi:MAG: AAA family ATPase, partial [Anaerolineae bacterium]